MTLSDRVRQLLEELDHLAWWKALSLGASAGVLLAVLGLDLLGGWWGLGIGVVALGGVVWLCWDVEPLLVLERADVVEEKGDSVRHVEDVVEDTVQVEAEIPDRVAVDMVDIPGGSFLRGSQKHEVTVSPFALGQTTVTRGLYRKLMDSHPREWDRDEDDDRLPANYVDWFDAVRFCNRLSEEAGLTPCYEIDRESVTWNRKADGYRLPTEAEWEYACRAGTTTEFFWGDDEETAGEYAWFGEGFEGNVHPVAEKKPNPWDLYDMAGNVDEWCWDWYGDYPGDSQTDPTGPSDGTSRVLRGGAFDLVPRLLRSANRDRNLPAIRLRVIGFRVACSRRQP